MISSISSYLSNPLIKTESASTAATKALEDATKARRALEVAEAAKEKTTSANSAGSTGSGNLSGDTLFQTQSLAQKFLEFMDKSPEEMLREAILKELGYTEEEVANMSPEDRLKVEEEIRQKIQDKIEEAMREKGLDVDVTSSTPLATASLTE